MSEKTIINELLEDKQLMKVIDDILYLIADNYNCSHSKACELIGELGMIAKCADLAMIVDKKE
jgi:hypothetical protein